MCVIVFAVGIFMFVVTMVKDAIFPAFKSSMNSAEVNSTLSSVEYGWDSVWDKGFFFVTVGMGMAAVIFAFVIDTHPTFFFASIFVIVILLLIAPAISNAFRSFASADIFAGYTERFPMTTWLFQNYPIYFLVFGFLMSITMYAKLRGGGQ